jgi:hypothetical protein
MDDFIPTCQPDGDIFVEIPSARNYLADGRMQELNDDVIVSILYKWDMTSSLLEHALIMLGRGENTTILLIIFIIQIKYAILSLGP